MISSEGWDREGELFVAELLEREIQLGLVSFEFGTRQLGVDNPESCGDKGDNQHLQLHWK